eukprot:TRINITY_DN380_c0_g1_i4.p1 TRINITY_DN380_c0_g1~~TRINITY_DN380_c0_g1_i4.p1  ORF type:complete len:906 (+),score=205.30 TRINITY_DN380_c0_g1_i4:55-2772(+)
MMRGALALFMCFAGAHSQCLCDNDVVTFPGAEPNSWGVSTKEAEMDGWPGHWQKKNTKYVLEADISLQRAASRMYWYDSDLEKAGKKELYVHKPTFKKNGVCGTLTLSVQMKAGNVFDAPEGTITSRCWVYWKQGAQPAPAVFGLGDIRRVAYTDRRVDFRNRIIFSTPASSIAVDPTQSFAYIFYGEEDAVAPRLQVAKVDLDGAVQTTFDLGFQGSAHAIAATEWGFAVLRQGSKAVDPNEAHAMYVTAYNANGKLRFDTTIMNNAENGDIRTDVFPMNCRKDQVIMKDIPVGMQCMGHPTTGRLVSNNGALAVYFGSRDLITRNDYHQSDKLLFLNENDGSLRDVGFGLIAGHACQFQAMKTNNSIVTVTVGDFNPEQFSFVETAFDKADDYWKPKSSSLVDGIVGGDAKGRTHGRVGGLAYFESPGKQPFWTFGFSRRGGLGMESPTSGRPLAEPSELSLLRYTRIGDILSDRKSLRALSKTVILDASEGADWVNGVKSAQIGDYLVMAYLTTVKVVKNGFLSQVVTADDKMYILLLDKAGNIVQHPQEVPAADFSFSGDGDWVSLPGCAAGWTYVTPAGEMQFLKLSLPPSFCGSSVAPPPRSTPTPAGMTPPTGATPTPAGMTPPTGATPTPAGMTPPTGATPNPTGTIPPTGATPTPAGMTPPTGATPNPTGTIPPTGATPTPAGMTPPTGATPTPAGMTPPTGATPTPAGMTPPTGATPNPTGTIPPPSGSTPARASATPSPLGAAATSGDGQPANSGIPSEPAMTPTPELQGATDEEGNEGSALPVVLGVVAGLVLLYCCVGLALLLRGRRVAFNDLPSTVYSAATSEEESPMGPLCPVAHAAGGSSGSHAPGWPVLKDSLAEYQPPSLLSPAGPPSVLLAPPPTTQTGLREVFEF